MAGIYYNFFVSSSNNFRKQIDRKVKAANTVKNDGQPNFKTVSIPDISNVIFAYNMGRYFDPAERVSDATDKNSPLFALGTLQRLLQQFSIDSVFRMHIKGDFTIITPWYSLIEPLSIKVGDNIQVFCADWLLIPIKTANIMEDKVLCFVPSSGLDDDDTESW